MIYEEYHIYKAKYQQALTEYDVILREKERLFIRTQPASTDYQKEVVSGGSPVNSFDNYIIAKEKLNIDERLKETLSILKDREMLLELKKEELYQSKNWLDIIYKYYYIENLSIRKIERKISFKYDYPISKSEIARKLKIIKENLGQNRTKGIVQ